MSITLKKNSLFVKDGGEYKDIAIYSAPQTVEKWLDDHPEVTTSIQDGEVTFSKLNSTVQNRISGTESNVSTLQSGLSSEASIRSVADTNLSNQISALRGAVGSPLVAATAAAMTDTNKIYVYTGNQSGYTNGNWYYYSGTAWASGGVYNEAALETDKTLAVEDKAADAKAAGDKFVELRSDLTLTNTNLNNLANGTPIETLSFVTGWTHGNVTTSGITSVTYRAYSSRMTPVLNQLFYFDDTKYKLTFAAYKYASDANARTVRSWQTTSPATQPFNPAIDAQIVVMLDDKAGSSATIDLSSVKVYTLDTETAPIIGRIGTLETAVGYRKEIFSPVLSSGKFISYGTLRVGMEWTDSLVDGSGVYLASPLDVSDYIGWDLIISADTIGAASSRAFGICDAEGTVLSRYAERFMTYDSENGKYFTQITVDGVGLYFSASTTMTGLEIVAVAQNYTTPNDARRIMQNSTVYVASDGDDSATGSEAEPFATIQRAINTGVETIKVYAGTYAPFTVEDRTYPLRIELAEMPDYNTVQPYVPKIVIQDSNSNNAITINRCTDVYLADIEGTGVIKHIFDINNVDRLEMVRCIAHDPLTASRSGFRLVNVNGVFRDCIAHDVTLDGFNIHGYGNTEFINCLAYDNDDDGISHHDGSTGYVLGGEFYGNGKGGIATPTYGARINIDGAYSHDNDQYGFYIVGGQDNPTPVIARVSNCLVKNNASFDFLINNANVVGWSNTYDTKRVDNNATFIEY